MSNHEDDHTEVVHDNDPPVVQFNTDKVKTKCSKNCRTICENLFILMFEFTGTFMLACIY